MSRQSSTRSQSIRIQNRERHATAVKPSEDLLHFQLRIPTENRLARPLEIVELASHKEFCVVRVILVTVIGTVGVGDQPDRPQIVVFDQETERLLGDVCLVEGRTPTAQRDRTAGDGILIGPVRNGRAQEFFQL